MPGQQLSYDEAGLLHQSGVREFAAASLGPGHVATAEVVFAISYAAAALQQMMRYLGRIRMNGMGGDPVRVMTKLHERRSAGLPLEELIGDPDIGPDIDGARRVLAELERGGMLVRSPAGDDRVVVRLTQQGLELMDGALRQRVSELAALADGISPEQLAIARHVCLQIAANRSGRAQGGKPSAGGAAPDRRSQDSTMRVDPGPIRIAQDLLAYVRRHSGAVHIQLRGARPPHLAADAVEAARRALLQVPHPLEPQDPFISYVSEVSESDRGPGFWFDAADAGGFDGIPEALINAICTALVEHGITGGDLTYPEAQ